MPQILKWANTFLIRKPIAPLKFRTIGFKTIPASQKLEEEHCDSFKTSDYYPVNIGDVYLSNAYQVVGKLGFGSTSTVWLARNLQAPVPANSKYTFVIEGSSGNHQCLVQEPMWDSWKDLLERNSRGRFSVVLLKGGLKHLLLALDYLHTQCKLVHTDIKADNLLHSIADPEILDTFVEDEMHTPSPRKFVDSTPIYMSRRFGLPTEWGRIILSDFGETVSGEVKRNHDAHPNIYRSPEVMLTTPWSYPIDIWNVGAMIWDVFEGGHLFHGIDLAPEKGYYTTRAHLAELIALLGPPPLDLIQKGARSKEFFSEDGIRIADCPISERTSLEEKERVLKGKNKEMFLNLMRGMLAWRPEDRKTGKELLEDPWLAEWDIED